MPDTVSDGEVLGEVFEALSLHTFHGKQVSRKKKID
jgi:hypothetical protein